ncbi:hypothetical protein ACU4GI_06220 [Cupriavidus basilensis]|uniref:hypothetical protein n=1 Tax=Cupriavidus sp. TaxID=1873897 RepID=UPI003D0DC763
MISIFNKIKESMWNLARSRGVAERMIHEDWSLNYKRDIDLTFASDILTLSELVRIHREAIKNDDLTTARCALIEAQGFAHNLSSLFWSIKEDLLRGSARELNISGNPGLDWPALPERYEYPNEYRYHDPSQLVTMDNDKYKWNADTRCWERVVD